MQRCSNTSVFDQLGSVNLPLLYQLQYQISTRLRIKDAFLIVCGRYSLTSHIALQRTLPTPHESQPNQL